MALPATGAISLSAVNTELGLSGTTQINMNDAAVRTLFGVPSGAIQLAANGYGKANQFAFSITSNQTNANLRTLAINAGWNQSSAVVATINNGVTIHSNSTGTAGLTVNGSWPGGVSLISNGSIYGQGGTGGRGWGAPGGATPHTNGQAGFAGGSALSVSVPITITNNGTLYGGGGGGGAGLSFGYRTPDGEEPDGFRKFHYASGGGGGGRSGPNPAPGGAGGSPGGNLGSDPTGYAGNSGTTAGAGSGGGGQRYAGRGGGTGGTGGDFGSAGSTGQSNASGDGANLYGGPAQAGGSAGPAVSGNSYITWPNTGTRYGPIS